MDIIEVNEHPPEMIAVKYHDDTDPKPMTDPWIALGILTAALAAICAPLGWVRRWPMGVMLAGTIVTAVLISTSIVQAAGWRALHGVLLVLFPVHGVAFAALGIHRREPRYLLLILTFAALTTIAAIRRAQISAPELVLGLRLVAIGSTLASIWMLVKKRREVKN